MLAIHDQHDQFTHQMRNRLKTTGMGLGLVRLLLDAGLTEEARTTLSSLEHGFQGIARAKSIGQFKPETVPREPIERRFKKLFGYARECEARIGVITQLRTTSNPSSAAEWSHRANLPRP
jgi:hypothetical protein